MEPSSSKCRVAPQPPSADAAGDARPRNRMSPTPWRSRGSPCGTATACRRSRSTALPPLSRALRAPRQSDPRPNGGPQSVVRARDAHPSRCAPVCVSGAAEPAWLRELAAAKPRVDLAHAGPHDDCRPARGHGPHVRRNDPCAGSGTPRTRRPTRAGASEHPWRRSAVRGQTRRDHPSYRPLSDGGRFAAYAGVAPLEAQAATDAGTSKPTRQSATQPRPARCRRG